MHYTKSLRLSEIKEEPRNITLSLKVSRGELDYIESAAKIRETTVSELIRSQALKRAKWISDNHNR